MCLRKIFERFLGRRPIPNKETSKGDMKYLIACLGNIGAEYDNTRHNIGFKIADRLAKDLAIENVTPVTPGYTVIFAVNAARGAAVAEEETAE